MIPRLKTFTLVLALFAACGACSVPEIHGSTMIPTAATPASVTGTATTQATQNSNTATPSVIGPEVFNPNWALLNTGLHDWIPDNANGSAIAIIVNNATQVVRLTTTLLVPPEPPPVGTAFVWPGLEPYNGPNPNNTPLGVLQSVLTWGGSCAPNQQPNDTYAYWWISGQFVDSHPTCYGGSTMAVAPGDALLIDMVLTGSIWKQTVTDLNSAQTVSYSIDMQGEWQNWILFFFEPYGGVLMRNDMIFLNTTITLADVVTNALDFSSQCAGCFLSTPTILSDNKSFFFPRIIIRAPGATPKSPN